MRDLGLQRFRVRDHRAELEDAERPVAGAHPHLPEEDGPPGVELDQDGDDGEDGSEQHEPEVAAASRATASGTATSPRGAARQADERDPLDRV